jgi:hypothetical protein
MKTYTKKDFHNPEKLTCQQVGEKHRLLLHEEIDGRFGCEGQDIAEFWSIAERAFKGGDLVGARYSFSAYRAPLATPLPDGTVLTSNECCWAEDAVQPESQEEWAAEKAAYAAGKVIEVSTASGLHWVETIRPEWSKHLQYRIKPEPQKPKVYCAGPMSGYPDYNFPAFFAASEFLEQQGYTAINPAQLDIDAGYPLERLKQLTQDEFQKFLKGAMKRDLDAIQSCDALVLLPGWESSKGARAERAVAEWAGLRVGYLWMAVCCPTGERMKLTWEKDQSLGCIGSDGPGPHPKGEPQPDSEGWIPHVSCNRIPCDRDAVVDVKFNCGKVNVGNVASHWGWGIGNCDYNIAAWRPHQSQPKQPYSSDERAEWDVDAQHANPEYTDAPYEAIDIKFHPNDPKGAAGAKKAPMHLLPPMPLMQLAWAMGHGAAKYGVNNFLDAKVLASTYIGAIGRHWAQFSSGEDNDNDSGLSHIALLAANCMILMAAADAGTLIDDRRKQ